MKESVDKILKKLESLGDPEYLAMGERFACPAENSWGVPIPKLRKLAKEIGKDHELALELWKCPIRDAKSLAALVDEPEKVTVKQMEDWVKDFDSWGLCDGVCSNLFDKTQFAVQKAHEWSKRDEEFVKRAGFVLMAVLAIHDKEMKDNIFEDFLSIIKRESTDNRNFVKKAVSWTLREIGKMRNKHLYNLSIQTAEEIKKIDSKSARWIASDALRELRSEPIRKRIQNLK
jgi:3-methyladenine DNA glycosylase AlkD